MSTPDYESIFKTSPHPYVVINSDLTVLDANDAYLLSSGTDKENIIGKYVFDNFSETANAEVSVEHLKDSLEAALKDPETGSSIAVESEGKTFVVTRQALAEPASEIEKYRMAAAHKDEFLSLLAHELRNPLSSINAAAEILTMGQPDPARLQKMTSVIKRQITLLASLTDNLSDVSHLSKGLLDDLLVLDIKHVIAEAIEQHSAFIDSKNHKLTLNVPSEEIKISGDHKRIAQALGNVLTNAAKYTPNGGNIGVDVSLAGEQVVIDVTDDGIGISSQLLPNIFDLFAQGKKDSDHSQRGLGIGLAVVKSIVEAHGGSISACSNGNAKGSRFEIRLPRLQDKE